MCSAGAAMDCPSLPGEVGNSDLQAETDRVNSPSTRSAREDENFIGYLRQTVLAPAACRSEAVIGSVGQPGHPLAQNQVGPGGFASPAFAGFAF
jgi:hypothetical protein